MVHKIKKTFKIDKVTEDSFYGNLLLGLPKVLHKVPILNGDYFLRPPPATLEEILKWERENEVRLPDDMKQFYESCNGFYYRYTYPYDVASKNEDAEPMRNDFIFGKIEVHSLQYLKDLGTFKVCDEEKIERIDSQYRLSLSHLSKVFELSRVDNISKVVLIFLNRFSSPSIWFFYNTAEFYFLAKDFSSYFRMCIAHLGIPAWQYVCTKKTLPFYTREMIQVTVPSLLYEAETAKRDEEVPENVIDPLVFDPKYVHNSGVLSVVPLDAKCTGTNTKMKRNRRKYEKYGNRHHYFGSKSIAKSICKKYCT